MDRKQEIMKVVQNRYDYLMEHGYNVMAVFLQGSQNYDLDIYTEKYTSDIDVKAVILPSLEDVVLAKSPVSTVIVLDNNEHIEVKDIRIMKDMFVKQNVSYLELLYTDYYVVNPFYQDEINWLRENRDKISNINFNQFLRCICGMSNEKYKALEHPYPTIKDKIDKFGYDPKQLHHIIRLNHFLFKLLVKEDNLEDCYKMGGISKRNLIDVKLGKFDLEKARELAKDYDEANADFKRKYSLEKDIIDTETINNLNTWVTNSLTKSLKSELGVFND